MSRGLVVLVLGVVIPMIWLGLDMGLGWTDLQRYYFPNYFGRPTCCQLVLFVLDSRGWHMALDRDVVRTGPVAKPHQSGFPLTLSEAALERGAKKLEWRRFPDVNRAEVDEWLRVRIYKGRTRWALVRWPIVFGSVFVLVLLPWALKQEGTIVQRAMRGHVLRGPHLVTCSEFNRLKNSDGIGFELHAMNPRSPAQSKERQIVHIPRCEETSHFLMTGDSGTGKSSLIRHMLLQIRTRGESAVVYDPALEFTAEFYDPSTDFILNPTDQRMPFWTPSDEVQYPAEAAALASSLFPDRPRDNTFFTESSRKIFAHLLRYRPTAQDLTQWMRNTEELDRRIAGTELEAMISKSAGGQRAAVQGTFNQAAAAFQLLPPEGTTTTGRWSAAEWAQKRKGWLFIPSLPTMRESLRPLLSMWLDSIILRLMGTTAKEAGRVWLVLDELSSLQRLPQLPTAITESRKSNISLVIGFQGRSQLELLYGHQAEAMLSQPMTKIFLRTSEPHAAEWVSRSIGEIEMTRLEESRTLSAPLLLGMPQRSKTRHWQRYTEPLVMASTIQGLSNMVAYLKSKDMVVPITFSYLSLNRRCPAFLPRAVPELDPLVLTDSAPNVDVPGRTAGQNRKCSLREDLEHAHTDDHQIEVFE